MPIKSDIPVIEEANPQKWAVDISAWRMRQIKAWQKAAQSVDIDGMNELIVEALDCMPDGSNPSAEALDNLTFEEWREAAKAVSDALSATFRATE